MPNPQGTPVWYELLTADPDRAKTFYDAVVGWSVEPRPAGEMDYRMIVAADGTNAGGIGRLTPGQTPEEIGGAGWRFYIGVDDVDASTAAITAAGGTIRIAPFDLPGVGRMAYAEDPQGIGFYIMHGDSAEDSTAYQRMGMGKCNWNELTTPDQAGADAFYAEVFGWTYPDKMAMPGDMGDYVFIDVAGQRIGATMTAPPGAPLGWRFYFRAPDIDAAAETVKAGGGTVIMGPHEVPGGDRIIVATDPEGLQFGVAAPGKGEAA